jgi:hypothetical protein
MNNSNINNEGTVIYAGDKTTDEILACLGLDSKSTKPEETSPKLLDKIKAYFNRGKSNVPKESANKADTEPVPYTEGRILLDYVVHVMGPVKKVPLTNLIHAIQPLNGSYLAYQHQINSLPDPIMSSYPQLKPKDIKYIVIDHLLESGRDLDGAIGEYGNFISNFDNITNLLDHDKYSKYARTSDIKR